MNKFGVLLTGLSSRLKRSSSSKGLGMDPELNQELINCIKLCLEKINDVLSEISEGKNCRYDVESVEGLYRKSGDTLEAKKLESLIIGGTLTEEELNAASSLHVIASAIKLVLSTHAPLIPYDCYTQVIHLDGNLVAVKEEILSKMTEINKSLLVLLLQHVERVVLCRETKMTFSNLAVCLGINLLRPLEKSMKENSYEESSRELNARVSAVTNIFSQWTNIFGNGAESMKMFFNEDRFIKVKFPKLNIDGPTNESELKEALQSFGRITNIALVGKKEDKMALVQFEEADAALNCLNQWKEALPSTFKVKRAKASKNTTHHEELDNDNPGLKNRRADNIYIESEVSEIKHNNSASVIQYTASDDDDDDDHGSVASVVCSTGGDFQIEQISRKVSTDAADRSSQAQHNIDLVAEISNKSLPRDNYFDTSNVSLPEKKSDECRGSNKNDSNWKTAIPVNKHLMHKDDEEKFSNYDTTSISEEKPEIKYDALKKPPSLRIVNVKNNSDPQLDTPGSYQLAQMHSDQSLLYPPRPSNTLNIHIDQPDANVARQKGQRLSPSLIRSNSNNSFKADVVNLSRTNSFQSNSIDNEESYLESNRESFDATDSVQSFQSGIRSLNEMNKSNHESVLTKLSKKLQNTLSDHTIKDKIENVSKKDSSSTNKLAEKTAAFKATAVTEPTREQEIALPAETLRIHQAVDPEELHQDVIIRNIHSKGLTFPSAIVPSCYEISIHHSLQEELDIRKKQVEEINDALKKERKMSMEYKSTAEAWEAQYLQMKRKTELLEMQLNSVHDNAQQDAWVAVVTQKNTISILKDQLDVCEEKLRILQQEIERLKEINLQIVERNAESKANGADFTLDKTSVNNVAQECPIPSKTCSRKDDGFVQYHNSRDDVESKHNHLMPPPFRDQSSLNPQVNMKTSPFNQLRNIQDRELYSSSAAANKHKVTMSPLRSIGAADDPNNFIDRYRLKVLRNKEYNDSIDEKKQKMQLDRLEKHRKTLDRNIQQIHSEVSMKSRYACFNPILDMNPGIVKSQPLHEGLGVYRRWTQHSPKSNQMRAWNLKNTANINNN